MKELNEFELVTVNGGNQPASTYMSEDTINAIGEMFGDFCRGFVKGFTSCY
jgi:hypothetical protein